MLDESTGRRIHQRFPCDLPVTLIVDEREFSARAKNISLGGLFLHVEGEHLTVGTEVMVRMNLPALEDAAVIKVTVRWLMPDGVGVQFGSLRALEVWGLNEFVKKLRGRQDHPATSILPSG